LAFSRLLAAIEAPLSQKRFFSFRGAISGANVMIMTDLSDFDQFSGKILAIS
jgi:hypothetical protein